MPPVYLGYMISSFLSRIDLFASKISEWWRGHTSMCWFNGWCRTKYGWVMTHPYCIYMGHIYGENVVHGTWGYNPYCVTNTSEVNMARLRSRTGILTPLLRSERFYRRSSTKFWPQSPETLRFGNGWCAAYGYSFKNTNLTFLNVSSASWRTDRAVGAARSEK